MPQASRERESDFEARLLAQVELCYAVALALVREPRQAEELVRETLSWAWRLGPARRDDAVLKMVLLKELRGRYLRTRRVLRNNREVDLDPVQGVGA